MHPYLDTCIYNAWCTNTSPSRTSIITTLTNIKNFLMLKVWLSSFHLKWYWLTVFIYFMPLIKLAAIFKMAAIFAGILKWPHDGHLGFLFKIKYACTVCMPILVLWTRTTWIVHDVVALVLIWQPFFKMAAIWQPSWWISEKY